MAVGGERARLAEALAKSRDVDPECLDGARGRGFAPEVVDQTIRGDDLVGMNGVDREELSLLLAAYVDGPALGDGFEGAENPQLQARSSW